MSGGIWSVNETCSQVFQVDQCKHSFGHNSLDKTDHYQIWSNEFTGQESSYPSLVAKEKAVTIATNAEVYKYVIFLSN